MACQRASDAFNSPVQMTNETETVRRGGIFVPVALPWLLGGGMFAVYVLTLYHSASPASLGRLTEVSGWNWRPELFAPLTYLATYPIQWLPDHLKLPALNLFAAACAALVLLLLARSVALLPHNQTNEQRQREQNEFGLLTIPIAWLPPVFAVLVCGLQMSFWERAVEFVDRPYFDNGEMFNLVLFAYVVRCFLEFRISRRESWLTRCAVVYGLGMANNWAMIGFFPVLLVALVWSKGFDFFQWRFLARMLACGLAGLSLLLLLPAITASQHVTGLGFGESLHLLLGFEKGLLLHSGFDRKWLLLLSLTSLVPVLLMGIRWAASFGDNSPLGVTLASGAMIVAHGFLLACCLWITLDPPFGPRQLVIDSQARVPLLSFYYLGALSVGYFAGYFLLIFGSRPINQRQRTRPPQRWFNRAVFGLVCLLIIAVPSALAFKNLPRIQEGRDLASAMDRYCAAIESELPAKDAVVLSDVPVMLYALQAYQVRQQLGRNDLFVDTAGVAKSWRFISMLDQRHPRDNPGAILDRANAEPSQVDCVHFLENLSTRHEVYYLQPSFGYYFERFYAQPRGLLYQLTEYPTNDWSPPPLSAAQIAENRAFWRDASNDVESLIRTLRPTRPIATNAWESIAEEVFFTPETNRTAVELAQMYSRALNYWGVALQRTAARDDQEVLREAGQCFDVAQQLNPQNGPALINLEFNRDLRQHLKPAPFETYEEKLPGNYRYWYEAINDGGPFDDPNFCAGFGQLLRQGKNFRQAIQEFQRVETLLPDDPRPPMLLAQTYFGVPTQNPLLYYAFPTPGAALFDAAAATDRTLKITPAETNAWFLKTLCTLDLGAYLQARTNDTSRPFPSSAGAYAASLAAADQVLQRVTNDPTTLSYKAVDLMQLKRYGDAVPLWSYLITTQSNKTQFHLTRAIAYFQMNKFDAAKSDYEAVIKAAPNAFTAYYGLGEIAYTNRNYPEALSNYELYLSTAHSNAPPSFRDSGEFKAVEARVNELKQAPP